MGRIRVGALPRGRVDDVASSRARLTVAPADLVSRAGLVDVGRYGARLVVAARSITPATESGPSYRGRFDLYAVPTYSAPEEEAETMIGSSGLEVTGDGTVYIGNGVSLDEGVVEVVANRAGTASLLWVVTSVAAGGLGSFTYVLRKNREDTAITFSISGASQRVNGSASTPTVVYAQGDRLSIKLVATGAARAFHNWTLKYL